MAQDDARAALEAMVLEARTIRGHLDGFALRAANHLGPGTHCSVSLRHEGTDRLVATSSARSARCDDVEYASGAGPCLTAMDHLQVVLVPDVESDTRWNSWRTTTLDEGFRSAAAVPARVRAGAEIALNLYSERLDPWDRTLLVRADTYAQQIATTVGLCLELADLAQEMSGLRASEALRETVDRAVGVTMAQRRCTADEALAHLRDEAVARGVDLAGVAAVVLAGAGGADGEPADGTSAGSGHGPADEASR